MVEINQYFHEIMDLSDHTKNKTIILIWNHKAMFKSQKQPKLCIN